MKDWISKNRTGLFVGFGLVVVILVLVTFLGTSDRQVIYDRFDAGDTELLNLLNGPSAQLVACITKCVYLDENGNAQSNCVQEEGEAASRDCWSNEACFAFEEPGNNGWNPCGGE